MAESNRHEITLLQKHRLTVSGVKQVASYDEGEIWLQTTLGGLVIRGSGFNITNLDLENGNLVVEGEIGGMDYTELQGNKQKALWQRLWK